MFHVKHSFPLRAPRPPRSCCQVFRLLRRARVPCALLRAHALVPPSARRRSASLLPSPGASRPSARVLALVFVRARHLSLAPHSSARNACLPRILAPPLALFRLASLPRSRSCCASPASALSHGLDPCYAPLPPTLLWPRPPIPPRSCSPLLSRSRLPSFQLPPSLPKIVTEQY